MKNLLLISIIAIIFWVSIWDLVEIMVEDGLKYFELDGDKYKLVAYLILAFVSFFILYYIHQTDSII